MRTPPRRPVISQHDPVRSHLSRIKSKRFWTPPLLVGITTAYQFFNKPLAELIAPWLPPGISPIATYINESINAANPAFVTLAVGITIYWLAGEPWAGIGRELYTMGIKTFFQTAKQDAINQLVDERADKLATERAERIATERAEQIATERVAEARHDWLQELRHLTPDEIKAMLEREAPDANSKGAAPN